MFYSYGTHFIMANKKGDHMRRVISVIILFVVLGTVNSYSEDNKNVTFVDENLKRAIIGADVDINNDGEISFDEASSVDKLILKERNITNIDGIQCFTNLRFLDLSKNNIRDINLLDNLDLVSTLILDHNKISDIKVLIEMDRLSYAGLNYNEINDFSPLERTLFYKTVIVGNPIQYINNRINPNKECSKWARKSLVLAEFYDLIPRGYSTRFKNTISIEESVEFFLKLLNKLMNSSGEDGIEEWKLMLISEIDNEDLNRMTTKEDLAKLCLVTDNILHTEINNSNTKTKVNSRLNFDSKMDIYFIFLPYIELETNRLLELGDKHTFEEGEITTEELITVVRYIYEIFLEEIVLKDHNLKVRTKEEIQSKVYDSILDVKTFFSEEMFYVANRLLTLSIDPSVKISKGDFISAQHDYIKSTGWNIDSNGANIRIEGDRVLNFSMGSTRPCYEYGMNIGEDEGRPGFPKNMTLDYLKTYPICQGARIKMLNFVYKNINEFQSEEEKVKLIYDFLLDDLEYDDNQGEAREWCIFNGYANRTGYAHAFKVLCLLSDVESYLVMKDDENFQDALKSSMPTMYRVDMRNAVVINGKLLYVDLALDDDDGQIDYPLFLLSEEEMLKKGFAEDNQWIVEGLINITYE